MEKVVPEVQIRATEALTATEKLSTHKLPSKGLLSESPLNGY